MNVKTCPVCTCPMSNVDPTRCQNCETTWTDAETSSYKVKYEEPEIYMGLRASDLGGSDLYEAAKELRESAGNVGAVATVEELDAVAKDLKTFTEIYEVLRKRIVS